MSDSPPLICPKTPVSLEGLYSKETLPREVMDLTEEDEEKEEKEEEAELSSPKRQKTSNPRQKKEYFGKREQYFTQLYNNTPK